MRVEEGPASPAFGLHPLRLKYPGHRSAIHGALDGFGVDAGGDSTALRCARKGTQIPDVEFTFATNPMDRRAVRTRLPVEANGIGLFAAPLGLQIGYKLCVNGDEDFGDARWRYRVAQGRLDETEIWRTSGSLGLDEAKGRQVLGAR